MENALAENPEPAAARAELSSIKRIAGEEAFSASASWIRIASFENSNQTAHLRSGRTLREVLQKGLESLDCLRVPPQTCQSFSQNNLGHAAAAFGSFHRNLSLLPRFLEFGELEIDFGEKEMWHPGLGIGRDRLLQRRKVSTPKAQAGQ